MDEARAVLDRLERIDALGRSRAPARELLDELRALVGEAEAWARAEGDDRARAAAERCEEALTAPLAAPSSGRAGSARAAV